MKTETPWLGQKIVVIGDIILDKYVKGYVDRISPEAPVPILNQTSIEYRLGGAANVALNIKRLGGEPVMLGALGKDADGYEVQDIFRENNIDDRSCFYTEKPTTIKTRYVTEDGFQLLRCDNEDIEPISKKWEQYILNTLYTKNYGGLVLVDYNKGLLTESLIKSVLDLSRSRDIPSVVDPIKENYTIYKECDLIKPNKKEAALALNQDPRLFSGEQLAINLKNTFNFSSILVTLGAEGMALLTQEPTSISHTMDLIKSDAHEVYDVSGAGDTVTAVMILGMASGLSKKKSAELASLAAGVAVEHHGTYAPTLAEVLGGHNGD